MHKLLFVLTLVSGSFGTASADDAKPKTPKSLYDRLGGKVGITAVVHDLLGCAPKIKCTLGSDKRINKRFARTDLKALENTIIEQVSVATGCTTCNYQGKSMPAAHKGMAITDDEFAAFIEDVTTSLDKFKVGEAEKSELLSKLNGMKMDVVGK